jgi:hypothetical protein
MTPPCHFSRFLDLTGNSDAFYNLGLIYAGIVQQAEEAGAATQGTAPSQQQQQQPQAKQPNAGYAGEGVHGGRGL